MSTHFLSRNSTFSTTLFHLVCLSSNGGTRRSWASSLEGRRGWHPSASVLEISDGMSDGHCESIIPSIEPQPESHPVSNSAGRVDPSDEVKRFYRLSGSQNGVPEQVIMKTSLFYFDSFRFCKNSHFSSIALIVQVGGLIAKNVIQLGITIAWMMLWLLSTRLGTFLLCGRASLSEAFPYVQRFAAVPPWKREKILYDWGNATGFALGSLQSLSFKLFKSICLFAFYTTVSY